MARSMNRNGDACTINGQDALENICVRSRKEYGEEDKVGTIAITVGCLPSPVGLWGRGTFAVKGGD
jgi:hypothetical protein